MESSEIREEKLHTEATVAPEGSQERNQDQHSADQANQGHQDNGKPAGEEQKGTRKHYDGSKPHGVVPAKLETVEAASNAKRRLQVNLEYLNREYAKCVSIIKDPSKSISEKAPAVKASEKINEQLGKLQKVANELKARVPELEELVKDSILYFDPATRVEVTI